MYDGHVLLISVVVPVSSNAKGLNELVESLTALKSDLDNRTDHIRLGEALVFLDDASSDALLVVQTIVESNDWMNVIPLSRTFGVNASTIAGSLHTSGDWVITWERDVPFSADAVLKMLAEAHQTEADLVYGVSPETSYEPFLTRLYGRLQSGLMCMYVRVRHAEHISGIRAIRGTLARAAGAVCGPRSNFDLVLSWFTDRVTSVRLNTPESAVAAHRSKARNRIFRNRSIYLKLGATLGFAVSAACLLLIITLLSVRFLSPEHLSGLPHFILLVAVLVLGGLSVFLLGLLLESMYQRDQRSHARPLFFTLDRSGDEALREISQVSAR